MAVMFLKAFAVWCAIAVAEVGQGILRVRLLNRRVGDHPARQIGVFTGSAIVLVIAWLTVPWVEPVTTGQTLMVGGLWVVLMLALDVGFGRLVFRATWKRIAADFDLRRGNLLLIGCWCFYCHRCWWRSCGVYTNVPANCPCQRDATNSMFRMTYIGGPTALLEVGGLRLLTDPTFDPAGTEYPTSVYTLRKTEGPAVPLEQLGRVDAVLLSQDHHFDNRDRAGKKMLSNAGSVLTTFAGAEQLKGNAVGLIRWQSTDLRGPGEQVLRVTGTPARHGKVGGDRGPVTGFVLTRAAAPDDAVYISGDTVWYEGVEEVARRFHVTVAVLFMGAAVVPQVGPDHLTMTAKEGVMAASLCADATIVPVHYAGWQHFSEGREAIQKAFDAASLATRLCWLEPGRPTEIH